ncbi:hypothetical protein HBI07_253110, partial [Parastagonospora nodorum]
FLNVTMKLSAPLEALVVGSNSPTRHTPAHYKMQDIFRNTELEAASKGLGLWSWLAISTAVVVTLDSPGSMNSLFQYTTAGRSLEEMVAIAEFMREIGFRCMGINGLPRTLNVLTAFRGALPSSVAGLLCRSASHTSTASDIDAAKSAGR